MKHSPSKLAVAIALATATIAGGANAQSYCKQIASGKETFRKVLYPFGVAASANEYL
jgi:hypothetical protein